MGAGLRLDIKTLHLIFWPPATAEVIRDQRLVQVYCLETINILLHMVRKLMSESVVSNPYLYIFFHVFYIGVFVRHV